MNPEVKPNQQLRIGLKSFRQIRPEFPAGSPFFPEQFAFVPDRTDLVLRVEIIDHDGIVHKYYQAGLALNNQPAGYTCFPDEEVIIKSAENWIEQEKKFKSLSRRKRRLEKIKGFFFLSEYQEIFKQQYLRLAYENSRLFDFI